MKAKFRLFMLLAAAVLVPASVIGTVAIPLASAKEGENVNVAAAPSVGHTLQKYFGNRPINASDDMVKLDAPHIIKRGDVAPVGIRATIHPGAAKQAKRVYVMADGHQDPVAKFDFGSDAGPVFVRMRVGLEKTTNLHGIVELTDGTLWKASHLVKVTSGGYGPLSGPSGAASSAARVRVVFSDTSTARDISDVLLTINGAITGGPSTAGFYNVEVAAGADQGQRLETLRNSKAVKLVERAS